MNLHYSRQKKSLGLFTMTTIIVCSAGMCGCEDKPAKRYASKPRPSRPVVEPGFIPMVKLSRHNRYVLIGQDNIKRQAIDVPSFFIATTETTQSQWLEVMNTAPHGQAKHAQGRQATHPVDCVSWEDAVKFCNRLSQREGLQPCYDSNLQCNSQHGGYRLPTVTEWAIACYGTSPTVFPWGDNWNNRYAVEPRSKGTNTLDSHTSKVESRRPNGNGLYDMIGNVSEWCNDKMGGKEDVRMIRGGDWTDWSLDSLQSKWLGAMRRTDRWPHIGFRVVRTAR